MRQSGQGTQALYMDLGSTEVLSSDYYYMLPNDVIYVPSLGVQPARMNLELVSIFLAAVSAAAVVVTVVQNRK
jgi:polysaccharide export outer membrane protein